MTTPKLFSPLRVGAMEVANRVVMAPLTRNRARAEDDAPVALHAEYYAQRAGAGLIITEATQIVPEGKGYAWTPGIYSDAQIAGWKEVTRAVHDKGGKIVLQLWHVGRVSHVSLQPDGKAPVAPSAITAETQTFDGTQFVAASAPKALETDEIADLVAAYATATRNAMEAGFDGVEVHGANGYLIDQFLRDGSNHRDDAYGGSVENRTRFLKEIMDAVTGVIGADRVGVRLSPYSNANDVRDSDTFGLFSHVVDLLDGYGLAYLHLVEGQTGGPRETPEGDEIARLRKRFRGVYMGNNGYDRQMAIDAVESGDVDLVAFGKLYISNPDLAERLKQDAPLNEPNTATFYGGGAEGYTDYPTLDQPRAVA
ncbi:alkene reductase [Brevirhabdus sp.]|uniref:alkene reductase n=1 Tax=Brevirhabdus sp. TaxID=2004514 RepID=UPI004058FD08